MAIVVREENFENFGKCLYIANEKQEMRVTLDVGPRIISYNLIGKKNMMFLDLERASARDNEEFKAFYGKDKSWYIYGGHRFWVSPEVYPVTYYPDNDPVEYTVKGNVFTFTPPVQLVTGWHQVIEITFDETDAKADVRHILTNTTSEEKTGSIWALSVTAAGGRVFQMMAQEDTGLVSNRNLILWPYNKMTDKRFYMDDKYLALRQDSNAEKPFKIGTNNTSGSILCLNNGTVFKKEFKYLHGESYPDYGCSTEVFTNNLMLEMETLSPLYKIEGGNSVEHLEKWSLTAVESEKLEDIVKYL